MKAKLIITITAIIFTIQLLNAQTNYMPVFGDTTRYYFGINNPDLQEFWYVEYTKSNDSIIMPIGDYVMENHYNYFAVNNTNSKIWGITKDNPAKRLLLMDLDLNVNDQYIDGGGCIHTVDSVYSKDGRKHIRFERHNVRLYIDTFSVDSVYFEFIEGVGNTFTFADWCYDFNSNSGKPFLRSQYKNGILAYGLPEWEGYWDYTGTTDMKNAEQLSSMRFSPSPVMSILKLEIPESVNLKNTQLSIYDISGIQQYFLSPTKHEITVDVSQLFPGIYLLKVSSDNYNGTVKFVKL